MQNSSVENNIEWRVIGSGIAIYISENLPPSLTDIGRSVNTVSGLSELRNEWVI